MGKFKQQENNRKLDRCLENLHETRESSHVLNSRVWDFSLHDPMFSRI